MLPTWQSFTPMSYLLTPPRTVLVIGGQADALASLRAALRREGGPAKGGDDDRQADASDGVPAGAGTPPEVLPVEGLADVRERLDERDDVGCVVVLDGAPDAVEAVCTVATDAEESGLLPVVATGGADVARTAARFEACRYLPADADETALGVVVGDALEGYARRRREAAESSLFRTLLDRGELSVFAKDAAGRHLYKADLEDDVYPDDVIGKTDVEVTPDGAMETAQAAYEDDLAVAESGEPVYERLQRYRYGGGHDHWSLVTKVPWEGEDGTPQGVVGFAQDVTLRKRLEARLEDQSDRIDQFVSYVSHDLRTPLQIIYGAVDQARRGDDEALDTVERAAERIQTIVDDLSHLSETDRSSRLSSSALRSLEAESMSTEVVPLAEEVWSVIAPDEATLEVDLPRESVVASEVETIRPVLENLFKNAVDHAGPAVTVRLGATDGNDLVVADDGPGIPEANREAVLEPGYTTAEDGTGTGLDLVVQTVERQRWELAVEDSESGGARFVIEGIPLVTRPAFDVRSTGRVELDRSVDVGPVSMPGSVDYDADADEWTVVADGRNVWGDTHEFHSVHGEATPPVHIQGRIRHLDGVHEFSKAGFAVRSGVDESAPFGYVGTTEAHGSEVTWRLARDGFTDSDQFEELPDTFPWYRVSYVDGVVTCYLSEDGDEWHPVDQRTVDLGETVTAGLLVCSHSGKQTSEATFADVRAEELELDE